MVKTTKQLEIGVMSQFSFFNEINSCVRMDDPITKGPVPRWQKKNLDTSNRGKPNTSSSSTSNKTPTRLTTENGNKSKKTPSKTPKKSPGSKTPGAKTPSGGDRFIPVRSQSSFEMGHFKINQEQENEELLSPSKRDKQRIMSENLHGADINKTRVLCYQNKAPNAPEGHQNSLKVVYSHSKTPGSVKSTTRYIPMTPDRILDAPDIMDDYYLNLIDWGAHNILAVALGSGVYLWNAHTGEIEQLLVLEGSDYVCSLSWIQEGEVLAVATSKGITGLWDCSAMRRLRLLDGHSARVGALSWNSYILSSGSRSGHIIHHDVRVKEHIVATLAGHTQEVCGLKWSPDGRYLASGGNDNLLNIWPATPGGAHTQTTPLYTLSQHQAAVKALAWCPWQPSILASGGGTADRCIRFWNCSNGNCLKTVDTKSQVCALLWSTNYREFISGHGYANNQLVIWKYPSMNKIAELTGHTARVLHLALSPDGSTVLSAGADETLRLWKCFTPDPAKKTEPVETKSVPNMMRGIR
ncbi:cell division cycle protein 20 homolog isoform X1 [Schistocerca nitens]|uniref:cell division cycle protein 20 homolog isoform X1 n=2 Tax=Schistocerca TaxID=7008 RepID=UPI002119769F|nr:cell division cycle protein 20 homolog isoform X1 [Schistocerca nitens]